MLATELTWGVTVGVLVGLPSAGDPGLLDLRDLRAYRVVAKHRRSDSAVDVSVKNAMRCIGNQSGGQIVRGPLGGSLGGGIRR